VSVGGNGNKRYVLADASPGKRDRIMALYAANYGADQGAVLLRLIDA
jgi:hypothetical protein